MPDNGRVRRRGQRLLQHQVHLVEPPQRVVHERHNGQESPDGRRRHLAGANVAAGVDDEQRRAGNTQHLDGRTRQGVEQLGEEIHLEVTGGGSAEALVLEGLHAERLHHPIALDALL